MPTAAQDRSPRGKVAFVRHVVATLNYSVRSGSANQLEGLMDSSCNGCNQYIARVKSDNANGAHVDGFHWRVLKGRVLEGDLVEVSIEADPYQKTDPEGTVSRVEAATYRLGFELAYRNNEWEVKDLYVPEPAQ
jgi:hypothetical protein